MIELENPTEQVGLVSTHESFEVFTDCLNKAEVSELLHLDIYCAVMSGVEVSFSGHDVE